MKRANRAAGTADAASHADAWGPAEPAAPGRVAFLLAQVGALAAMRFAERLAPVGLTPAQAGLLRVVAAGPGRTQQAVANQLGLLPSRLVVLVDELESQAFIERRRDPDDRRNYALYLAPGGRKALREIGIVAQSHGEDFLRPLAASERAVLAQLLDRLALGHGLTPDVHPGYRGMARDRNPQPQP